LLGQIHVPTIFGLEIGLGLRHVDIWVYLSLEVGSFEKRVWSFHTASCVCRICREIDGVGACVNVVGTLGRHSCGPYSWANYPSSHSLARTVTGARVCVSDTLVGFRCLSRSRRRCSSSFSAGS